MSNNQKKNKSSESDLAMKTNLSLVSRSPSSGNVQSPGTDQTSSLVELSISCQNLPDCDVISKSDPQVFVYLLDLSGKVKTCEIGRTEVIQDNLNPKFVKKITLHYHFEQIQRLRFEVYDIDPVGSNDFLGALETTLADIVAARSATFKKPLFGGPRQKPGYLIVDVEELIFCKQVATFEMSATDLPTLFCGLLAPTTSVHLYRSNESGSLTIVYRSPSVRRDCNPKFVPFTQKLVTLCNGDLDRTIRFELIHQLFFSSEYQLGFFETTINCLKSASKKDQSLVFDLLQNKSHDLRSGSVRTTGYKVSITEFKLTKQASFLDFIKAGAQLHFVIAIDFTASNGDPNYADSLHYLDPMGRKPNPYEQALMSVGNILKPYDTQGLFAGFGFGAKLSGHQHPPSHLFPLNGNDAHPYVLSVEELLEAYRRKLKTVTLSGPTNFAPCITHCDNIAKQFQNGDHYFVLLIVTDGIISDMTQTKKAIIEASKSPMSIIICGVGDAEFSAMDELDSDDVVMQMDGRSAQRDIVQFVPMNKFKIPQLNPQDCRQSYQVNSGPTSQTLEIQRLLAEEVLKEIPDQLTGYMLANGFHPRLTQSSD